MSSTTHISTAFGNRGHLWIYFYTVQRCGHFCCYWPPVFFRSNTTINSYHKKNETANEEKILRRREGVKWTEVKWMALDPRDEQEEGGRTFSEFFFIFFPVFFRCEESTREGRWATIAVATAAKHNKKTSRNVVSPELRWRICRTVSTRAFLYFFLLKVFLVMRRPIPVWTGLKQNLLVCFTDFY